MKIIQSVGNHSDLNESCLRSLIDEILARPLFAHLATASESGVRESPVWFLWESEALWIIGNCKTDTFPSRIERESRCAVGIVDFNLSIGLVQHVGFRGEAAVQPHDAVKEKRLLSRYLGNEQEQWDTRFVQVLGDTDFVLIRFVPETAVVRDQSYVVNENTRA